MPSLVKTPEEIEKIRTAGKILGAVLRQLKTASEPGVSLLDLDKLARKLILEQKGVPAFLGYRPDGTKNRFPYSLCTSVNETVVHGKPSSYRLKSGDVLKLDLGVNWRGGIADAAVSLAIGKVSKDLLHLIKITKNALAEAVRTVRPGHTIGDIGFSIERVAAASHIKVLEGLTGHGVGNALHEDPIIYNYGKPGTGMELKEGMVLAIEPMTSLSTGKVIQLGDDSFVTSDKSVSAHFEHTVLVTSGGAEILTG